MQGASHEFLKYIRVFRPEEMHTDIMNVYMLWLHVHIPVLKRVSKYPYARSVWGALIPRKGVGALIRINMVFSVCMPMERAICILSRGQAGYSWPDSYYSLDSANTTVLYNMGRIYTYHVLSSSTQNYINDPNYHISISISMHLLITSLVTMLWHLMTSN